MVVALNSVGSGIDDKTLNVYPQFADGSYDYDSPSHLVEDDIVDEWFDTLSHEDILVLLNLLN
jgi:hypothetical protein